MKTSPPITPPAIAPGLLECPDDELKPEEFSTELLVVVVELDVGPLAVVSLVKAIELIRILRANVWFSAENCEKGGPIQEEP